MTVAPVGSFLHTNEWEDDFIGERLHGAEQEQDDNGTPWQRLRFRFVKVANAPQEGRTFCVSFQR